MLALTTHLFFFIILLYSTPITVANAATTDEECDYWAEIGECDKNPDFMWDSCESACLKLDKNRNVEDDIKDIKSFFDLSAKDIDGEMIDFEVFRGKVTIVVNVASYCGYTEQHYKELVQLHRDLVSTEKVEILAFPCNQFGKQEPEPCPAIKKFAKRKGVEFTMMDKIDVNGPTTSPVYKYLKKMAGPARIQWNFNTYFVISADGYVQSFSDVLPSQLKDVALELIDKEL